MRASEKTRDAVPTFVTSPAFRGTNGTTANGYESHLDWLGREVFYRDLWGTITTTTYDDAGQLKDQNRGTNLGAAAHTITNNYLGDGRLSTGIPLVSR